MQIVILPNADAVGHAAADLIHAGIESGTVRTLGVATGSSPLGIYDSLAARRTERTAALTAFALDEYVGLDPAHPESYTSVIRRTVTEPLGLDPARVILPDGGASDLAAASEAYEDAIDAAGGIDLQILGIGSDGHIGFNEPGSSLSSRTRVKTLTPITREDNARFFDSIDEVPVHSLTQGLGTILEAGSIVLVATGRGKADAVAQLVEGPLSARWPATVLQMHPAVTVFLDEEAASGLELTDYYRFIQDNRPR